MWLVAATGAMTMMRLLPVAAANPQFRLAWNASKAKPAMECLLVSWRQGLPLGLRQEVAEEVVLPILA